MAKKVNITSDLFPKQLPAKVSEEPEEIIDTTWSYPVDFGPLGMLAGSLILGTPLLWVGWKLLEFIWIIFSGLFVCVFLGC